LGGFLVEFGQPRYETLPFKAKASETEAELHDVADTSLLAIA
jgi:hypothetical protein